MSVRWTARRPPTSVQTLPITYRHDRFLPAPHPFSGRRHRPQGQRERQEPVSWLQNMMPHHKGKRMVGRCTCQRRKQEKGWCRNVPQPGTRMQGSPNLPYCSPKKPQRRQSEANTHTTLLQYAPMTRKVCRRYGRSFEHAKRMSNRWTALRSTKTRIYRHRLITQSSSLMSF